MSRYCIYILFFILFWAGITPCHGEDYKLKCVVIDPGHGGNQPGTVWGKYKEKDITLNVSLKLGSMIESAFPGVKVIYTRTTDVAVDLSRRGEIANNAHADLFISVHVNASKSTSASGTETFVMGSDKSSQNLDVAMAENSVISYEDDYKSRYEGFDPSSAESYIIFSLMQYSYLENSLVFASHLQDRYTSSFKLKNRGVKQAGFLVLWKTAMPSVLTEIGFLSNAEDRAFLITDKGQSSVAEAIFKAFASYKSQVEGISSPIITPPKVQISTPKEPITLAEPAAEIKYSVQVKYSTSKLEVNSRNFGSYADQVWYRMIDGRHKYFVGEVNSYKEALSLQNVIRRKKFKDAFIVAFNGDKQITVAEANKITGNK